MITSATYWASLFVSEHDPKHRHAVALVLKIQNDAMREGMEYAARVLDEKAGPTSRSDYGHVTRLAAKELRERAAILFPVSAGTSSETKTASTSKSSSRRTGKRSSGRRSGRKTGEKRGSGA